MSCLGPSYLPQPARAWTRFQNRCPDQLDIKALKISEENILGNNEKIPLSVKYRMPQYKKGNILQYKANSANLTKKQIYSLMARGKWTKRNITWASQSATYTNPNTQSLLRVNSNYAIINTSNDPTISDTEFININCPPKPKKKTFPSLPPNASESQDPGDNPDVPPQPQEPGADNPTMPGFIEPITDIKETVVEDGGELICDTKENPCTGEVYTGPFKDDCFPTSDSDVPGSIEFLCWNNAISTFYPRNKTTYGTSGNKWPYNYKGFVCGSVSADTSPVLAYQTTSPYASKLTLSWTFKNIDAISGVTYFSVYENDIIIERLLYYNTNTSIDNLATGVSYTFYIKSEKKVAFDGNISNTVNYFIPFPTHNLSVSDSVSNSSSFYTILNWSEEDEGGSISGYKIYVNNQLIDTINDPDINTYNDVTTSFISNQTYFYSLASYSSMAVSSPTIIVPITIPFPTYNLSVNDSVNDPSLFYTILTWSQQDEGGSISGYKIYLDSQLIDTINDPDINTYNDDSDHFTASSTYYYTIASYSPNGTSCHTTAVPITIPFPEYEINNNTIDYNENPVTVTIYWEETHSGGNVISYEIYRSSDGGNEVLIGQVDTLDNTNNFTDTTIVAGETYTYKLKSVSSEGTNSDYSEPYEVQIPFPVLDLVESGNPEIEPQSTTIIETNYNVAPKTVSQYSGWNMTIEGTASGGGTGSTYSISELWNKPYSGGGGGGSTIDFIWDNQGNINTNEQNTLTYEITNGKILLCFDNYNDSNLYEISLQPGGQSTDYTFSQSSTGGLGGQYETNGSNENIGITPSTDLDNGTSGDPGDTVITNGIAPPSLFVPKGGLDGFNNSYYGKGNNGTTGPSGSVSPENQYLNITYVENSDYQSILNLNKIILTWSISTNGGNIDGFHIYQNNDSNPIAMVNSDTFTYTTDELTSNTEYTFYVTSYTNDTESTPSTTIEYCTP